MKLPRTWHTECDVFQRPLVKFAAKPAQALSKLLRVAQVAIEVADRLHERQSLREPRHASQPLPIVKVRLVFPTEDTHCSREHGDASGSFVGWLQRASRNRPDNPLGRHRRPPPQARCDTPLD